jgi:3-hydroxybutyryl-CoA dehydratase
VIQIMPTIREKAAAGIHMGDRFAVTRTLAEADVVSFAGITKDYNPVHFS